MKEQLPQKDVGMALPRFLGLLGFRSEEFPEKIISITHAVEQIEGEQILTCEFMVPAFFRDQKLFDTDIPQKTFLLTNALSRTHAGPPEALQQTMLEMHQMIQSENLQPITPFVTIQNINIGVTGKVSTQFEVWISINPNHI